MDKQSTEVHNFMPVLEGIVISALAAFCAAWLFLKAFYWWDDREATKIAERMRIRQLIRHGKTKTSEEIFEQARINQSH